MLNKESLPLSRVLCCAFICASFLLNFTNLNAQTKRLSSEKQIQFGAPALNTTLTDSFPDLDSNGKADPGEEVTYTATITNNGFTNAENVSYSNSISGFTTLVPDSVFVQSNLSQYVVRCTFDTASGGSSNCGFPSTAFGQTDSNNNTILGGQGSRLNFAAANTVYDSMSGVFSFDATVQNLLEQSLGTIDNITLEAAGVRLFLNNAVVNSGNGIISAANANGTQTFTAPNQPFFQYDEILVQNETSAAKNLQFNVPNTVNTFTLDFLVSAKVSTKLIINEVLANPGGTISDANGEWFEIYNTGLFPVNLQNFYLGDTAASGDRPIHLINQSVTIQPNGYLVCGNTTNTTNNGGVPVNYAYGAALTLANSLDAVRILSPYSIPANPFDTPPFPGYFIELDRTNYLSAATSAQNGISRELRNPALDNVNMDGSNWADASVTSVYGPGGRGTPNAQNSSFTPFAPNVAELPQVSRSIAVTTTNSGENVSVNLGTIAPGDSVNITYRVTLGDPLPNGTTQISNQGTISGSNFANVTTDDPATVDPLDATVTLTSLAPTAASVTISGQVTDGFGRTVSGANVIISDSTTIRTVKTNSFGYYNFFDIEAGSTVIVSVNHKQYVFAPQVVSVNENVTDLNFTAETSSLY